MSAWLKGARWKVLATMREKKQEAAPSWELTWRSITDMVTGPEPMLLSPVTLGSRSNGRPVKSVIGETDVSDLAPAAAFDVRWLKALNSRTPSFMALDASATPRPCPGTVRDANCPCQGLDTPMHLFGSDRPSYARSPCTSPSSVKCSLPSGFATVYRSSAARTPTRFPWRSARQSGTVVALLRR